jgi:hypothetical protein
VHFRRTASCVIKATQTKIISFDSIAQRIAAVPTISLTSFLKILTKGTPQKVQEYGKYLTPGGYDFYWQLKEAAHALTVGGESYSDCAKGIEEINRDVERKHNLDGLKSLSKWLTKNDLAQFFEAPTGVTSSPRGRVSVKLEPEFGTVMNGQRRIIQVWNSKGSNLTRTAAGVGIFLLERHLCVGDFADCKGGILDLRRRELFGADALPATIAAMVASEFAWLDGFFEAQGKAA